jgi:TetR/AcrR family transcriptional regulator
MTKTIRQSPIRTQHERSDQTRARILEAAISVFSEKGMAGARTEQIATAAGVNKALLYYYFKSKETLYEAALDRVADLATSRIMATMNEGKSAGERLLHFALDHFDRLHAQHNFQSLMHQEMVRMRRGEQNALPTIVEKLFRPMTKRVGELIVEGRKKGELIETDPWQMMNAVLGANAFYFLSAPVVSLLTGRELFSQRELRKRRKLAIEYLGQTLFTNRAHGARVAERVLASTPMPVSNSLSHWQFNHAVEEKHR